jgi:mono/diheme cytochrome c family protein
MSILSLAFLLVACGGDAKPVSTAPVAPVAAPAPVEAAPAPAAPAAASGSYTPDEFAAKAYAAAKAANSDGPNPKAGDAAAIAAGKAAYAAKCTVCHGVNGAGDGVAGAALPQKPSNFHDKVRWDATSAGVKFWIIKNGVQGSAMGPLGLSDDEAWQVLAYLENDFVGK